MYTYDIKLQNEDFASCKNETHNILEVFIQLFAQKLFKEFQAGIYKEYITEQDNLTTLRGKYLINENLKYNFVKNKIYCEYDEFSMNNELNQFFLYATKTLLKYTKNKKLLKQCELVLDEVEYKDFDINNIHIHFNRLNNRFKDSFEFAILLLSNKNFREKLERDALETVLKRVFNTVRTVVFKSILKHQVLRDKIILDDISSEFSTKVKRTLSFGSAKVIQRELVRYSDLRKRLHSDIKDECFKKLIRVSFFRDKEDLMIIQQCLNDDAFRQDLSSDMLNEVLSFFDNAFIEKKRSYCKETAKSMLAEMGQHNDLLEKVLSLILQHNYKFILLDFMENNIVQKNISDERLSAFVLSLDKILEDALYDFDAMEDTFKIIRQDSVFYQKFNYFVNQNNCFNVSNFVGVFF